MKAAYRQLPVAKKEVDILSKNCD